MTHRPSLVIFDWDGTLMDSISLIVDGLLFAAQAHQLTVSAQEARLIIGLGLPEAMEALFPAHPSLHAAITASYSQYFMARHEQSQLFSGALELLAALKAQGSQLAIATGKSRVGLDRVLTQTQLTALFDVTRCASETKSKPDPTMLHEIMQVLAVDASQCVMVGDTTFDLDMAKYAGMQSIAVTYGAHDKARLLATQPNHCVDSVEQLRRLLVNGSSTGI